MKYDEVLKKARKLNEELDKARAEVARLYTELAQMDEAIFETPEYKAHANGVDRRLDPFREFYHRVEALDPEGYLGCDVAQGRLWDAIHCAEADANEQYGGTGKAALPEMTEVRQAYRELRREIRAGTRELEKCVKQDRENLKWTKERIKKRQAIAWAAKTLLRKK